MRRPLVVAALALAGCGGASDQAPLTTLSPFQDSLQGAWTAPCEQLMSHNGTTSSRKEDITFSGLHLTSMQQTFSNGTCTGAVAPWVVFSGTISLGAEVTAALGTLTVTAHQVDGGGSPLLLYDLIYVDSDSTPARLYHGERTFENDGSTPARRPTSLFVTSQFVRP
jgi:hypothetical protein